LHRPRWLVGAQPGQGASQQLKAKVVARLFRFELRDPPAQGGDLRFKFEAGSV